ncbi:MAG: T9SS type A sorting domain-containing protein, partial [Bacteroidota bacterium]
NCQTPTTVGFEVWANEAYLLRGLTIGAEYTFEFCDGYNPNDWAANITVAEWDGNNATANIATISGCSITFTATVTDVVAIIFNTCGNPELQVDNGFPTFRCTGNGTTLPDNCPALPEGCTVSEDFSSGQPVTGWAFTVTGTNTGWQFNSNPFSSDNYPNPGSGNWAYYDDDAAGNNGQNNIATAISPSVDMSNYENISLEFDYNHQAFNGSGNLQLSITDETLTYYWNGSAWTTSATDWLTNDASGSYSQNIPSILNKTSLSVGLEYNDQGEWAWGFGFDNFNLCGDFIEDNCLEMLPVNGDPMNSNIIDAGTYTAQNTITSKGTVEMGTSVTFEAGQSITLDEDFFAENGSTFTARIAACTPSIKEENVIENREEEVVLEQKAMAKLNVFPNPFRNQTTIELVLEEEEEISMQLYDIAGKQVMIVVPVSQQIAGKHQYEVNASALGTGIYLLRVQIGSVIQTHKLSALE